MIYVLLATWVISLRATYVIAEREGRKGWAWVIFSVFVSLIFAPLGGIVFQPIAVLAIGLNLNPNLPVLTGIGMVLFPNIASCFIVVLVNVLQPLDREEKKVSTDPPSDEKEKVSTDPPSATDEVKKWYDE